MHDAVLLTCVTKIGNVAPIKIAGIDKLTKLATAARNRLWLKNRIAQAINQLKGLYNPKREMLNSMMM